MKFVNFAQKNSCRKDFRSRSCGLIKSAASVFLLCCLCILPVYAADPISDGGVLNVVSQETDVSVSDALSSDRAVSQSVQQIVISEPLAVYEVPNPYAVETAAMIGDIYEGSISSSILDYLSGYVPSMSDYVIYRSGQYTYLLYYGTDFDVSNRVITGSGSSVLYNSYSQTVVFGESDFSVNSSNAAYVYSNLEGYSDYTGLREVSDLAFQSIILFAIFLSDILRWIWK